MGRTCHGNINMITFDDLFIVLLDEGCRADLHTGDVCRDIKHVDVAATKKGR